MRNFKRAYFWCSFVAACAFFVPRALLAAEPEPPVIERCNSRTYHIRSVIKPMFAGVGPESLYILAPMPQSSLYQTVSGENFSPGEIRYFPSDCGKYILYSSKRKAPPQAALRRCIPCSCRRAADRWPSAGGAQPP